MQHATAHSFFMGLLLAVAILALLIFLPFLTPLIFAVSLSVIFRPVYHFFLWFFTRGKEKSTIASLLTVVVVILLVLIPSFFVVTKIYTEIQEMYFYLTEESSRSVVIDTLNQASTYVSNLMFNIYPALDFDTLNITDYLQQGVEWAFSHVDTLFTGLGRVLMGILITFFALFYFLRDGRYFKKQIIALSPLMDSDDEHIFMKLEQAVYSIVGGSLIVSVVQGILTGIGFALFQVPQPAVWGSVAAVAALVPGVGTALVIVPGILYLFFTGHTLLAIGLLVWGLLAVGLIDNLLGPVIMNRGIKIHPFIILLSVLGGIAFFGVIGFILGPLILAFLFALLEIYKSSRTTL